MRIQVSCLEELSIMENPSYKRHFVDTVCTVEKDTIGEFVFESSNCVGSNLNGTGINVAKHQITNPIVMPTPAEPDNPHEQITNPLPSEKDVIIIKCKNSPKQITLSQFPPELPMDCRTSCVKLKAYLRRNPGKYKPDDINAMRVLIRRNSQNKASKRHRNKMANIPETERDEITHANKIDVSTQTE